MKFYESLHRGGRNPVDLYSLPLGRFPQDVGKVPGYGSRKGNRKRPGAAIHRHISLEETYWRQADDKYIQVYLPDSAHTFS